MNMKTIITITAVAMYVFVIAFQSKKVVFTTLAAAAVILLGTFFPGEFFPLPEDILALEGDMPVRTYALIHSVTERAHSSLKIRTRDMDILQAQPSI